jgi:hypothetical protein
MRETLISRQWPADMLGVSTSWLARANGVSERTIRWRRRNWMTSSADLPQVDAQAALAMARVRPVRGHLCLWSRLAILERVQAGVTYRQAASEFSVSIATVQRAVRKGFRGYDLLACTRVLSSSQIENLRNSRRSCARS